MAQAKTKTPGPVEKKLVGVADVVLVAADRSKDPTLSIPVRSLANVNFNEKRGIIEMGKRKQARTFFNVGMAKKFMQTVLVADALAELQRANLTTSLREIYYRAKHTMKGSHENTFDGQNESDPLIEDLEVALSALREELHVRAENAGSVVGPLVLGDDPWGYYIYSVVKQGSINLAFESERMAIPKATFLGLSSADPDRYGLPRTVGIKLNDKDVSRARELLRYAWFQKKAWQDEIKRMLAAGLKYELDALANKDFRYVTKTYLPRKLKERDWLD